MSDKTVLVTGAGGYIGRHVVTALLDRGAKVVAVDRNAESRPGRVDPRATVVSADIFTDHENLFEQFHSPDVCIHLAWEAGFVHDSPVHIARLSDHHRFLTRLVEGGLSQLAVLGTVHEVGYHEGSVDETTPTAPLSLYGVAKNALRQALEIETRTLDTTLQWLRCFYIYGDDEFNNSIFTKITQAAARGDKTFPFTSGQRKFDFLEVSELAQQIAATALQDQVRGIINCCSGEPVALGTKVESYIKEHGLDIALDYGRFPDRPYDSPAVWGDATKIRSILAASEATVDPARH